MTVDKGCGEGEVSPSRLSRRLGLLRSQHHVVLAFLSVRQDSGRVNR